MNKKRQQIRKNLILEVRAREKIQQRERVRKFIGIAQILVFLIGAFFSSYFSVKFLFKKFFFQNSDYNLEKIEIRSERYLDVKQFQEITGVKLGENLFSLDLDFAEKELEKVSEIKDVKISKELPNKLVVDFEIRKPVAWISNKRLEETNSELLLLVEADGNIFESRVPPTDYYGLPVICSVEVDKIRDGDLMAKKDLQEALDLLGTKMFCPWSTFEIMAIEIRGGYALEVIGKEGVRVLFAKGNYIEQLSRLQKLLDYCKDTGRKMEYVNLFPSRNTAVRFLLSSSGNEHGEAIEEKGNQFVTANEKNKDLQNTKRITKE
ncbi:MAG: FtsQ-type POTRA domain-containing protein [Chthoniobacterales bacterium]|nr:FtsQ-type POTRA domain-containing protein [Chthoniobacterales bacterium]